MQQITGNPGNRNRNRNRNRNQRARLPNGHEIREGDFQFMYKSSSRHFVTASKGGELKSNMMKDWEMPGIKTKAE